MVASSEANIRFTPSRKQLKDQIEALAESIIYDIELLEASGIRSACNDNFSRAQSIISVLTDIKNSIGGDGE